MPGPVTAIAPQVIAKKAIRPLTLFLSEESITARLEKTRGFGSINQMQSLMMVSKNALQLALHDRLHVAGATNRGNVLGPLSFDNWDDREKTWNLKVKDKFMLFGRHGPRIPVGGPLSDDDVDDDDVRTASKAKPRDKEQEEPLLFHTVPHTAFEELIHSMDAVSVIALAGDGKAAISALERRLPFFGLAFTPEHAEWLTRRLEGLVFKRFQDPLSKLYQPGLVQLLGTRDTSAKPPAPHPDPAAPPMKRQRKGAAVAAAAAGPPAEGGPATTAEALLTRVKAMAAAAADDDADDDE